MAERLIYAGKVLLSFSLNKDAFENWLSITLEKVNPSQ